MKIPAMRVFLLALGIIILLLIAHIASQAWLFTHTDTPPFPLATFLDMDNEASIPTWFSQSLLLASATVAGLIAYTFKGERNIRWHWIGIAGIILFLSLDEGASIHETLGVHIGQVFGSGMHLGFVTLRDWVLVALLGVSIIAILYLPFIWKLPIRTKALLGVSAGIFIFGAAFWESLHFTTFGFDHVSNTFAASISHAVEEGSELIGTALLLYALLDYLQQQKVKIAVAFEK